MTWYHKDRSQKTKERDLGAKELFPWRSYPHADVLLLWRLQVMVAWWLLTEGQFSWNRKPVQLPALQTVQLREKRITQFSPPQTLFLQRWENAHFKKISHIYQDFPLKNKWDIFFRSLSDIPFYLKWSWNVVSNSLSDHNFVRRKPRLCFYRSGCMQG